MLGPGEASENYYYTSNGSLWGPIVWPASEELRPWSLLSWV